MKKPRVDPFAKAKENREVLSKKHRERFEAGEEEAIFEFIQMDESNIREPWVLDEVIEWIKNRDARRTLKLARRFKKPFSVFTEVLSKPRNGSMLHTQIDPPGVHVASMGYGGNVNRWVSYPERFFPFADGHD